MVSPLNVILILSFSSPIRVFSTHITHQSTIPDAQGTHEWFMQLLQDVADMNHDFKESIREGAQSLTDPHFLHDSYNELDTLKISFLECKRIIENHYQHFIDLLEDDATQGFSSICDETKTLIDACHDLLKPCLVCENKKSNVSESLAS